jgi:hypothetical protein
MMNGTRNVTKRLSGRCSSAFIDSGSAMASRNAVATTKRMSIKAQRVPQADEPASGLELPGHPEQPESHGRNDDVAPSAGHGAPRCSVRPSAYGRKYLLSEQPHGLERVDGEADGKHEAPYAGGPRRAHLRQALIGRPTYRQTTAEIVE